MNDTAGGIVTDYSGIRRRGEPERGIAAIPLEETLQAEVDRTRLRYEAACRDLARWRLAHGGDRRPEGTP